jgi:hypothetical protein
MTDIETLRWTAREILPMQQSKWLDRALEMLRVDFYQIGEPLPREIAIKVEYPYGELTYLWLGTCLFYWSADHDPDFYTIFINPSVDGLLALDVFVHELVHTVTNDGHGDEFMGVASAIGLDDTGPTAGAEEVLLKRLKGIQETLGSYPLVFDCLEEA